MLKNDGPGTRVEVGLAPRGLRRISKTREHGPKVQIFRDRMLV
jgi:hypothetical protein